MIVLLAAAVVGGVASFTMLWPYGVLTALLGAQLGGTFLLLVAGLLIALQRSKAEQGQERKVPANLDEQKAAA